jgi:hypothetical protein
MKRAGEYALRLRLGVDKCRLVTLSLRENGGLDVGECKRWLSLVSCRATHRRSSVERMERRTIADACTVTRSNVVSSFAASPLFHSVSSSTLVTSTVRAILLPLISLLSSIVSLISVVVLLLRRPVMLVEGVAGLE